MTTPEDTKDILFHQLAKWSKYDISMNGNICIFTIYTAESEDKLLAHKGRIDLAYYKDHYDSDTEELIRRKLADVRYLGGELIDKRKKTYETSRTYR